LAGGKTNVTYISGTVHLGILYSDNNRSVCGFCDANSTGDPDKAGVAVSWGSKLQPTVAASTFEAEYSSSAYAVKEGLCVGEALQEFESSDYQAPLLIYYDNQRALELLKHPNAYQRTKHIDVAFHFARDRIVRGEVSFEYCQTDRMVAECLTKAVPVMKFKENKTAMGLVKKSSELFK
jgi:hypothetical protein